MPTRYNGNSLLGILNGHWKYIQTTRPELFDLHSDPEEARDLLQQQPLRARRMEDALKQMLESLPEIEQHETTPQIGRRRAERLEALGYVAGSVVEDFGFDRSKEDPKDLIQYHTTYTRMRPLLLIEKYDEARQLCEKLIALGPDLVFGHLNLGHIAVEQGDHEAAAKNYARVLKDFIKHNQQSTKRIKRKHQRNCTLY